MELNGAGNPRKTASEVIKNLDNILFLDVETVSAVESYEYLDDRWKALWNKKAQVLTRGTEAKPEDIYDRASIYAEFGRIICISVGVLVQQEDHWKLRIKSFYDPDEKVLLTQFSALLKSHFSGRLNYLCAHNGKEFDFPYLCRRLMVHGLELPAALQIAGKKPWEVKHLDTMHLWKFGDYKSYTSLELLAALFNIPSPKNDLDGSMIHHVYYKENDMERIVEYCQKDVLTLVRLYLKFNDGPELDQEFVEIV